MRQNAARGKRADAVCIKQERKNENSSIKHLLKPGILRTVGRFRDCPRNRLNLFAVDFVKSKLTGSSNLAHSHSLSKLLVRKTKIYGHSGWNPVAITTRAIKVRFGTDISTDVTFCANPATSYTLQLILPQNLKFIVVSFFKPGASLKSISTPPPPALHWCGHRSSSIWTPP